MSFLHPVREYRFRRAFQHWKAGRTERALPGLQDLAPADAGARLFLPLALAEGGREDKAREEAGGTAHLPRAFLGVVLLWGGKPGEAVQVLEEASRDHPLEKAVLGQALLEAGRKEEAARTWFPAGPGPWRVLAPRAMAVLLEVLHREEPEKLQERLVSDFRGEETPQGSLFLSRLFHPFLDLLKSALPALKGDRFALERIRILSLASRGEWPEAVQRARRLRREFKTREEATNLLVQVLFEAREDRALLELGGDQPGRAAMEGVALACLGRWDEALPRFEKALEEEPEDLLSAYGAACALALQGKRNPAARGFLRVLALEETAFVEVLDREARCFLERERAR